MIYLDYAAATPLDKRVRLAMEPYFSKLFANPSANTYAAGRDAKAALSRARSAIASMIGAKPTEITFTAGGTEANNLAIQGILNSFPGNNIVTTPIEHPSVYQPASLFPHKVAKVDKNGIIDLVSLAKQIDSKTVFVSVIMVNHEIGTIQPLKNIAKLIRTIRDQRQVDNNSLPLYFHSDACQAANYLDLHPSKLGVDLMTVNGSKIYGPKQSGFLWVKTGVKLSPIIYGGGQEHGLRSGTENLPAIVGLSKALELNSALRKKEADRLEKLRDYFISQLLSIKSGIKLNGSETKRIANNVHITIPGLDNEWLLIKLDSLGIQAAAGSACSASDELPSNVLKALGLSDALARNSIRFTLGRQTTKADIDKTLKAITNLIK